MPYIFRHATGRDMPQIEKLVHAAALNNRELDVNHFVVLEKSDGTISAIAAIEPVKSDGLLRALVFLKEVNEEKLLLFFQGMIEKARQENYRYLFLLTKSMEHVPFFHSFGFELLEHAPSHIEQTEHYQINVQREPSLLVMVQKLETIHK